MGSQRVGHNLATKQQQLTLSLQKNYPLSISDSVLLKPCQHWLTIYLRSKLNFLTVFMKFSGIISINSAAGNKNPSQLVKNTDSYSLS